MTEGIDWRPTADAVFTVKSAYWLGILGVKNVANSVDADFWKLVWNIDGPPKLCHFLWRVFSGAIGDNEVMRRRHIRGVGYVLFAGVRRKQYFIMYSNAQPQP
uniref:Reverse transcriptase zinc-binding domain-containing protein n=1 Tax=Chenopodium quinoa TaxID=63459 RepID=A0A803MT22_CHEQI